MVIWKALENLHWCFFHEMLNFKCCDIMGWQKVVLIQEKFQKINLYFDIKNQINCFCYLLAYIFKYQPQCDLKEKLHFSLTFTVRWGPLCLPREFRDFVIAVNVPTNTISRNAMQKLYGHRQWQDTQAFFFLLWPLVLKQMSKLFYLNSTNISIPLWGHM